MEEVNTTMSLGKTFIQVDGANVFLHEMFNAVIQNQTTTTTTYMGGIVYQNDVLQFIPQEEGRIRVNSSLTGYIFDYYLKDHLGNTRMTITDDNTQTTLVAQLKGRKELC
jgi:hypothetical protein